MTVSPLVLPAEVGIASLKICAVRQSRVYPRLVDPEHT